MQTITNPQIKKLHCLFQNMSIDSKGLIHAFTKGRTDSTANLSKNEAITLITVLTATEEEQRLRRIIYSLAYQGGIIYGDSELDINLNRVKLNLFLKDRGTVKKDLESMNVTELKKTHMQFEAIVRHSAASKDNKAAKAATDKLLTELNLTVQSKINY